MTVSKEWLILFACFWGVQAINAHSDPLKKRVAETSLAIKEIKHIGNKQLVSAMFPQAKHQAFQLYVINENLKDYQHIYTIKTISTDLYQFTWQPKEMINYRLWVVLNDAENNTNIAFTDLFKTQTSIKQVQPLLSKQANVAGYQFILTFDQPNLKVGKAVIGTVKAQSEKGSAEQVLEPLRGEYFHIAGFYYDFATLMPVKIIDARPASQEKKSLTKAALKFAMTPQKKGFIKLFMQIKINGKELLVPFGISVNE